MTLNSEFLMSKSGMELLRKLFESSGEGIMFFNDRGEIQAMNPRSAEMFGYEESELTGKKVEVLVPQAQRGNHHSL